MTEENNNEGGGGEQPNVEKEKNSEPNSEDNTVTELETVTEPETRPNSSYVPPPISSPITADPKPLTVELSSPLKEVDQLIHQNYNIIKEATDNQNSTEPERIYRNASLLKQLDQNLNRIVELYSEVSSEIATQIQKAT